MTLDTQKIEETAEKAIGYLSGAAVSAMVFLGDQLGLYRTLREAGKVNSLQLAAQAELDERWVREWLHSQAAAGLVDYLGDGLYELTAEQAAVLADEENPNFITGGFALVFPLLQQHERLLDSFRTGLGVPYNGLGIDHAVGESRFSAPWLKSNLVPVILPGLDDVTSKLTKGAKVADLGCGSGTALLEIAQAYPNSQFHGYDSAEVAIAMADQRLTESGLTNVTFYHATAESIAADNSYDFILTWDCLHDMLDPLAVMRAIRKAIKPDGSWLIVDINGMPTAEENYEHPLGGFLYSISVLDCLACSTCEKDGEALGTLGFPEPVARKMTNEAGFTRFSVHDFGNPLNSFYEVRP